nr:DUF4982 domain-containing protein [Bacteroidales bacterium]
SIDLPHDWSIEDLPGTESPIDSTAIGGISAGYYVGGTGWYRKSFDIPAKIKGKKVFIQFDGVYMDAHVWINGQKLGNHPYGYTSFWYDISDKLNFGDKNVLAIKVANEGMNSRWYSGSGIYRHVWLTISESIHISQWGTAIVTPEVSKEHAKVVISNDVKNETDQKATLEITTSIYDNNANKVGSVSQEISIDPGVTSKLSQALELNSPDLWSPDSPVLYKAISEIRDGNSKLLDHVENNFGVRSIEFSVKGFFLNGENILLKGGCLHHDNGPLGAAAYDRAEERKVELMKASGFNSVRCAHNPPSPAFLDACDRLGMLVIDEAFDMWRIQKNPMDYHRFFDQWWKADVGSMLMRDRNHPSIIMWSTGNEIPERGNPEGVETSKMLTDFIHQLDPSRPVTSAVNGLGPDKDPYFATLDIAGYNYSFRGDHGKKSIFEQDHARLPDRIMYCSESYPLEAYGAWMDVVDNPYVIGDFVWTGFDYLGEASIGWLGYFQIGSFYPWNQAYCGDIDICGWKRPQSYYRDVLWDNEHKLSIFVKPPKPSFEENPDRMDWSKWHWQDVVARWEWPGYENEPLTVEVYCGYEKAELFLNGKSLGMKETNRGTEWIARWQVPYEKGTLKVVGYEGSEMRETKELMTSGEPKTIQLKADRANILSDNQDLSYITVDHLDKDGNRSITADNHFHCENDGPGSIIAVASSNPMSAESFQKPYRKAYHGRCLVVIKSEHKSGEIILKASSSGLENQTLSINTN